MLGVTQEVLVQLRAFSSVEVMWFCLII